MNKDNVSLKQFAALVQSTNAPLWMLILGIATSVVSTLVSLFIPLIVQNVIDGSAVNLLTTKNIIIAVIVVIAQMLSSALSTYYLSKYGQFIVAKLRDRIWDKMIKLPIAYFDQHTSGELASRVVNDTGTIRETVSSVLSRTVSGIFTVVGVLVILFALDVQMTMIMLISIPVLFVLIIPLGRFVRRNSRDLQDKTAEFSGNVQESLSEIRLLKSSTAEENEGVKGHDSIQSIYQLSLKEAKVFAVIQPIMSLVMLFIFGGIFIYGGMRVSNGSMSVGDLVAFVMYLFQLMGPIGIFTNFFTLIQKAAGATSRIVEILELNEEVGHDITKEVNVSNQPIVFEHVDFAYNEDDKVLKDISFVANPNEKLAFVGPSGSGKTTIFSLIEQFYQPTSGEILIGDIPINQFDLTSWRWQIGYVSQENSLLSGTVRANLLYGLKDAESISDERLWEVAEMAYAKEFIEKLPDQLDTEIGERGIKLSGGQRQRINIARAFLRDPKILLLDEATASLDSHSEQIVQDALERLMVDRMTLVIAHRLSTIVDADNILIIENGHIVGEGTHEELLKNNAVYQNFSKQQLNWN